MSKVIMYHYIRYYNPEISDLNFLHKNHFNKQIKYFEKNFSFFKCKDGLNSLRDRNKLILTFDDGLKEHLNIAKYLYKKNIKGIFFISTKPLMSKDFLTVHKIHLILGVLNIFEIRNLFKRFGLKDDFENSKFKIFKAQKKFLAKSNNKRKIKIHYKVKLNLLSQKNSKVIGKLFNYCFSKKKQKKMFKEFYLNIRDIIKIKKYGMEIGSHGHDHKVLSLLSYNKQHYDVKKSLFFLKKILKQPIKMFCYPYGGKTIYNEITKKILKKLKIKYAFSVESKEFNKKSYLLEIPRFDCNEFPHGRIFIKYKKKYKN